MKKLHDPANAFLIGPMGSGKTSVGRALAEILDKTFIDLDQALEDRTGVSVSRIFDEEGEAGFRAREKAMLEALCKRNDIVLATGGGTVLDEDNRRLLRASGLVVYLKTSVDLQLQRLEKDKQRPLLRGGRRREKLERLSVEREPLYLQTADVVVESEALAAKVMAQKVLSHLQSVGLVER